MNTEQRKKAATFALQEMRSQLDRLPEADREAINVHVAELREKAKDMKFAAAMKIVILETQLGEQV